MKGPLTLVPMRPLISAGMHNIRPFLFVPPSATPDAISTTVPFSFSFSSSLPHSSPCLTPAQCVLCNASSSGAPLVYDRSQREHVRRIDWSILKCNCVRVFCCRPFGLLLFVWSFEVLACGRILVRFLSGNEGFTFSSSSCRARLLGLSILGVGGGLEDKADGGDDGGGRQRRLFVPYVRWILVAFIWQIVGREGLWSAWMWKCRIRT